MRFPFHPPTEPRVYRQPVPARLPHLPSLDVAAQHRTALAGGDFFELLQVARSRALLVLLDIAGPPITAMHIAAAVQQTLRTRGPELFAPRDLNEADALTEFVLAVNRAIIAASGGAHQAPGFLACYSEELGTLTYINAGHVPAFAKDGEGVRLLEAHGLPLGLFSHATHDAQLSVLVPGDILLLVSRGLIEVRGNGEEFGVERVRAALLNNGARTAGQLCTAILDEVCSFAEHGEDMRRRPRLPDCKNGSPGTNDITAVALVRRATARAVTSTA